MEAAQEAAFELIYCDAPSSKAHQLSLAEAERRGLSDNSDVLDLTYGDISLDAMRQSIAAAAPPAGGIFYDLGSGSGRGVISAALCGSLSKCVGVEVLQDLHTLATTQVDRYHALRAHIVSGDSKPACLEWLDHLQTPSCVGELSLTAMASTIELTCADLFEIDVSSAHVVFCCCVTWDLAIMQRLATKLATELTEGSRVITVGRPLPASASFVELWHGYAALPWGHEPLIVHTMRRGPTVPPVNGVHAADRSALVTASGATASVPVAPMGVTVRGGAAPRRVMRCTIA